MTFNPDQPKKHSKERMTTVVNVRHGSPFDVYIGRVNQHTERSDPASKFEPGVLKGKPGADGVFGNPFTLAEHGHEAIDLFRIHLQGLLDRDPAVKDALESLRGKRLGCFCKPGRCHGDVIVEFLHGREKVTWKTLVDLCATRGLREPVASPGGLYERTGCPFCFGDLTLFIGAYTIEGTWRPSHEWRGLCVRCWKSGPLREFLGAAA